MSVWRRKAIEAVPSSKAFIEEASGPMALWIELYAAFLRHVKLGNADEIRKLLMYAAWCGSDKSGKLPNETSTAVYCAFYEDIGSNKTLWRYFSEWFYPQEYKKLRSAFSYGLTDEEMKQLDAQYYAKTTGP